MEIQPIVEHETKKIFKENGVKIAQVARALNLAFTYTSQILSGTARCTRENDRRLRELAASLKKRG